MKAEKTYPIILILAPYFTKLQANYYLCSILGQNWLSTCIKL